MVLHSVTKDASQKHPKESPSRIPCEKISGLHMKLRNRVTHRPRMPGRIVKGLSENLRNTECGEERFSSREREKETR